VHVSSMGSNFGTGGMQTKLIAADLATAAGVATVILNGNTPGNIIKIVEAALPPAESAEPVTVSTQHATPLVTSAVAKALAGTATPSTEPPGTPTIPPNMTSSVSSLASEDLHKVGYPPLNDPPHTIFLPFADPLPSRKWSILHALHPSGSLIMDEGAYKAIRRTDSGGRLLPAGVVGVEGNWERMQAVRLMVRRRRQSQKDSEATQEAATSADEWEVIEVGRGLANYTSIECERIKGLKR
jgi:glutamate 5-kinase